ncbi:hypothetical protein BpOF4_12705 [Alkalihalophilus pseudofirmus OF4]|uniref:Uncharacterized protein n=1 Tax=Alkalihalophilus pseudofirmus (strain ATCC BAA-2126 / JCM 17055 / OF4) TaxID=398511 RepID=D3FWU4_ALKPO|nr:hypothetical protein [Alkalihalophilus pseudofirmus]ADC50592.1 hypothetical protein BpOF4_12705 [Alkalihalophilus pseudofirmus OF4]
MYHLVGMYATIIVQLIKTAELVRGVDHLFKLVRGTGIGTENKLEALKDSSSTKEKIFKDVTEAELFAQKLNSNTEPSHHWYVEEYK